MRRRRLVISLVVFCSIISFPYFLNAEFDGQQLKVHFINVGQGDSIFIETPNGRKVLIDGGPPSAGDKVVTFLMEKGIKELDLVISTHPDIDHIGGLIQVLDTFKVKELIDSGKIYTTATYFEYLDRIRKNDIPVKLVKPSDNIPLDPSLDITVLNSPSGFKSNNASSLALSLHYKEVDFLLMADVEKKQESDFIEKGNLKAEILKVGHHGSETSTSFEFLREIHPETAILSYSINNTYGHPVDNVVENLQLLGTNIYSTAKAGDISIYTNGEEYDVKVSGMDRVITRKAHK
ncbi:ComEC/Rec2 family competence protein [Sediminibacillus massiliensis]|uniref:ComEC/Rec2 family competence protein n=1 Tax=Sediminibacillus massiliensis TaxID=1926277 RepID=UPI00098853EE|nr:MBL fold metallo-hydrolase [Sediminibacillus massiliensis]